MASKCGKIRWTSHGTESATRRGQRGMTLIEVVLSLALLAALLTSTMMLLLGVVRQNRVIAMEITAGKAINEQLEELRSAGNDNAVANNGFMSQGVVAYYADSFKSETIAVGPNQTPLPRVELDTAGGRLVYRFWVSPPGESRRFVSSDNRNFNPSPLGLGEMSIYLQETSVHPIAGAAAIWEDIGGGETLADGFDMNQDGKITAWTTAPASLGEVASSRYLDEFRQVPVDITVTYFSDASHRAQTYSVTRRAIVAGARDLSYLMDGKGDTTTLP